MEERRAMKIHSTARSPERFQWHVLSICFTSMQYPEYFYCFLFVIDLIQNPIVACSDSVFIVSTNKFFSATPSQA